MKWPYLTIILLAIVLSGCGRKMDPLPPGNDPVELLSGKFTDSGVMIKIYSNIAEGSLILLGKPKGICPSCIDDMKEIARTPAKKGRLVLNDNKPDEVCMVYRVKTEKNNFISQARIVCR